MSAAYIHGNEVAILAERKQAIIEELAAEGLLFDPLAEEVGKDFDPFDLICHVAFDHRTGRSAHPENRAL